MTDLLTKRVRPQSLVDAVTERLEAAIVSGELAPGSRLSEQGLATSLGVSRGPLREAIRRLEGRKLVERTPNIGVRIARLSLKDLAELLIVREALEGMACALAAENMADDEVAALERLLDEHGTQQELRSGTGYYQEPKDFDFHFRLITASRNERLMQMLSGDLYDLLRVYRYKSSTLSGRATRAYEEHRAILAAIKARDPQAAEARMREHIRNARLHVEAQLDDRSFDAEPAPGRARGAR
jgi:DNA-binding GntR family transcriptional regulator